MVNVLMADAELEQLEKVKQILETSPRPYNFYPATSAKECRELLDRAKMDIVILDTGLPDQAGIEMAQEIRKMPGYEFAWMIISSPDFGQESAAYRLVHCYDYLVKPYDTEKLMDIIEKLGEYKITPKSDEDREMITFKQRDQYIRVLAKDILYIEVIGNNSTLYTYSHVYCLRKMSLRRLKMILPDYFVQCHKSFLVNRNQVEAVQKGTFGWEIKLKNFSRSVPSGDKYKENVMAYA